MSARVALWAIAPVVAAWREAKLAGGTRETPALKRWSPSCVLYVGIALAGAALLTLGIAVDRGWLFPMGGYLCAVGIFKFGVRVLAPRAVVRSEADFNAFTSMETLIRVAIWAGLVWALASERWNLAFGFGLAAAVLAVLGLAFGLVAHRFSPWRKQHEREP